MSEGTDLGLGGLDLELARRIDAVCRRFEADRRAGTSRAISDYLGEVTEEGRPALRIELEALDRELHGDDETSAPSESGSVAEAPTIAPPSPPKAPMPGLASPSVHEDATVAPGDPATVDLGSSGPTRPDPSEPARIRYFGDYEVTSELARGGMGVVFRARQMSLNRPVALKMILAGQLANDTDVKRFYTEAEAAANLDHPGIVPIFEVGQHEGQHYFSMGFVEGHSLSQRLAEGPLPPREAAALLVKVAEAIEYAHLRGVIHRDLKPGNILLDRNGNPRVTDFGLAKKLEGDSGLTGSGQIMGTPSYMPPEQAGGNRGEVGPAADVYALGATLYALVTGRPPFQAATPMDTVLMVISDEPVPLRRLNASVPRDLETICLKCLEKEPKRRYGSAAALADDLRRFLDGEPIVARPVTRFERTVKWARRKPAIAALWGLVALVTATGLGGVLWQWREAVLARGVAVQESGRATEQATLAESRRREADTRRQEAEKARSEADARRREAELARAEEARQKLRATQALAEAETQLYYNSITLADREWQASRIGRVEPVLARCPERLRAWEWHFLRRLCHADLLTFRDHASPVNAVAFSSDGTRIASADDQSNVLVWDAGTGKVLRRLSARPFRLMNLTEVTAVAFRPDGKQLAASVGSFPKSGTRVSSTNPEYVTVWNLETGAEAFTLKGHTGSITGVAYSRDGKRLASVAYHRLKPVQLKVWDTTTGKEQLVIPGAGRCVAFSPDGRRLASAGGLDREVVPARGGFFTISGPIERHAVKVWDAATGAAVLTLRGHTDDVTNVAFSRDGRRLASASRDRTARIWDLASGKEVAVLQGHTDRIDGLAYRPDGSTLATAGDDRTVRLWDARTGAELAILRGHAGTINALAFRPDGRRLVSCSDDKTVKVWDAENTQQGARVIRAQSNQVALDASLKRFAHGRFGKSTIVDLATGATIRTIAGDGTVLAMSADGGRVATMNPSHFEKQGQVNVWETTTGRLIHTIGELAKPGRMVMPVGTAAFGPDGRRLVTAGFQLDKTTLWDAATGRELAAINEKVCYACFSPDGRALATASLDGDAIVKLWDAADGHLLRTIDQAQQGSGGSSFIDQKHLLAFSPDGRRLAWSNVYVSLPDNPPRLVVFDSQTGEPVWTIPGLPADAFTLAFSPDGRRLAAGLADGSIVLYDAASGQELLTLSGDARPGAANQVRWVSFSSDGQRLASFRDWILTIWDGTPEPDR